MERRGEALIQVRTFYSPPGSHNFFQMKYKSTLAGALVAVAALTGAACHSEKAPAVSERPIGKSIKIAVPLGLPGVPVPSDNPQTAEAVILGRRLFYDKKLSS